MGRKRGKKDFGTPPVRGKAHSRRLNAREQRAHIVSAAWGAPAFQEAFREASDEDGAVSCISELLIGYFPEVLKLPSEEGESPNLAIARHVAVLFKAEEAASPP